MHFTLNGLVGINNSFVFASHMPIELTAIDCFNGFIVFLITAKLVDISVGRFYKRLLWVCVLRHDNNKLKLIKL